MTVTSMAPTKETTEEKKGGGRKKIVLAAVLVLALCGAGWFFFLKPEGSTEPVAGEVMALEAVQVNLAGGHYLRVGLALQLTEEAHEAEGSKALDAAISIFSGLEVAEVSRAEQREALRAELSEQLDELYHGEVMGVYFTEFVTQ